MVHVGTYSSHQSIVFLNMHYVLKSLLPLTSQFKADHEIRGPLTSLVLMIRELSA